MKITEIPHYTMNPDLLCRDIGQIRMVYNKRNGDMYELNDMGAELFTYLQKEIPLREMVDSLCAEYEVQEEDILEDVTDFVVRMIELGVIDISVECRQQLFSLTYQNTLDVDDYLQLREAVGWEAISRQQAQRSLEGSFRCVSCLCNGKITGCARVMWDGGYTAFLVDVMVRPEWQKKGIGSHLLQMLQQQLEEQLSPGDKLMVNLYSSAGKEAFYEKQGFSLGSGMVKWIRK